MSVCRDVAMGGMGASRPPNIFKFARKLVKKVSQTARGLVTAFFVTFLFFSNNVVTIVGQFVRTPPPPQQKVSRHITDCVVRWMSSLRLLKFHTYSGGLFY